jgi:hypothetical protein
MIKRTKVKLDDEYIVLSHLIMDSDALSFAYRRYKAGELKTHHFTQHFQPIFRWIIKYYGDYGKAPGRTIQRIYKRKQKYLGQSAELIEDYLDRLATEYASLQEEASEYIINEVILDFIRQQALNRAMDRIQNNLDKGDIAKAEAIAGDYRQLLIEEEDLDLLIPGSEDATTDYFARDLTKDVVFRFPNELGWMIGNMEKGWLVAITGIEKSGKSYLLQEIGLQAAMHQKKKVLVINLELTEKEQANRVHRRLSGTANRKMRHTIPIFDCDNNQYNTCEVLSEPPNRKPLFDNRKQEVNFFRRRRWIPCDQCRNEKVTGKTPRTKRFIPAIWFKTRKLKEVTEGRVKNALRERKMQRLGNFRVKCFPRFSKTFDEVYDWIKRYIEKTGWYPDMIIWDYLDILAPETGNLQERIDVDRKWKKASMVAGEMNCLCLTADQATKASRKQRSLDIMSTSESKTKDSHLDVRVAINQMGVELAMGLIRVGVLFHRHEAYDPNREIIVAQNLMAADPLLDFVYWHRKNMDYPVYADVLR